jgi:hypothetical protein
MSEQVTPSVPGSLDLARPGRRTLFKRLLIGAGLGALLAPAVALLTTEPVQAQGKKTAKKGGKGKGKGQGKGPA